MRGEILRFLFMGLASNIINYATYLIAYKIGMMLIIASSMGYLAGLFNSYYFGRYWVFNAGNIAYCGSGLRFVIIYSISGIGMVAIIEGFDQFLSWDYRFTWFAGAGFAMINNFWGLKLFVFREVK